MRDDVGLTVIFTCNPMMQMRPRFRCGKRGGNYGKKGGSGDTFFQEQK